MPDGRLALVYTDPDGVGAGDFGNYEEEYPMYSKSPYYQRKQLALTDDSYDFVLVEGEPLPEYLALYDGEQEIISEDSYEPVGILPIIPNWSVYEDFPEDINKFLIQFPSEFVNNEPRWDVTISYIWWDGQNDARITWQNSIVDEDMSLMLDKNEREFFASEEYKNENDFGPDEKDLESIGETTTFTHRIKRTISNWLK
jgi:hypothetical protein